MQKRTGLQYHNAISYHILQNIYLLLRNVAQKFIMKNCIIQTKEKKQNQKKIQARISRRGLTLHPTI